ncbi:MAG: glycosyltransferase family 1 protein, partial [Okeania sp. SIO3B3]|nr:glycosyltransferase family 1 protein [Okeania sp. SIO3B3]
VLRDQFSQTILDTFRAEHAKKPFDVFFAYLMDGMVDTGALDEIRKIGVPTCNFSCNNIHQFDLVDSISPHFDFNLHAEKHAREKFLAINATPLWWQMASNPTYFKPQSLPRTIPVSFVGANYALRGQYIAHLLMNGVAVHAYGPGWMTGDLSAQRALLKRYWFIFRSALSRNPVQSYYASAKLAELDFRRSLHTRFPDNVHPPISDADLIALYSRSQISLGFLEVYDKHDPTGIVRQHLHLREFEAPMSGALYCTGYSDELAEFFEPDQEVITYRNQHELLDKVQYYLAHPDAGDKIRAAGHARALRDHTYHRRYETLFQELGLCPA